MYTCLHTLSLLDALPIWLLVQSPFDLLQPAFELIRRPSVKRWKGTEDAGLPRSDYKVGTGDQRSEEHTSELQSLMRISYAGCCLKTKITRTTSQTVHLQPQADRIGRDTA